MVVCRLAYPPVFLRDGPRSIRLLFRSIHIGLRPTFSGVRSLSSSLYDFLERVTMDREYREDGVVCTRCGCHYLEIKVAGERCDDMSGHGGTFERPCRGVLVSKLGWDEALSLLVHAGRVI